MQQAIRKKMAKKLDEKEEFFFTRIIQEKQFHRLNELPFTPTEIQAILENEYNIESTNIFRTRKSRDLYTQLLTKIKQFATTPYTKILINTLFQPTINPNTILLRQKQSKEAKQLFESIKDKKQLKSFIQTATEIRYSSEKKHRNIVIAIGDNDLYEEFKSKLGEKFFVTFVETEHDLLSINHYEQIRFLPGESTFLLPLVEDMEQAIIYSGTPEIEEVAPEFITDIIEEQKESLLALLEISKETKLFEMKSFDTLTTNQKLITTNELDNLIEKTITTITAIIKQEMNRANFSGEFIMQVITEGKNLLEQLPDKAKEHIAMVKENSIQELKDATKEPCNELISISHVGQVSLDEETLEKLKKKLIAKEQEQKAKGKQELAIQAKKIITALPKIMEEVYKLDMQLCIGTFITQYQLQKPQLTKKGISFVYGKNMNIEDAVPVEYHIGIDEQVSILTGANSGGKTTLLELLGQIQLLTQMGLFVPASETKVGIIEELYYFSKQKGNLGAGAFETLLKQFANISTTNQPRLILADEIESVTEPDVAAKIIKGIIDHIITTPVNELVLVTHIGRELSHLKCNARFDGIEAKGLDKDFNLVVDRNPIIGRIARSTPQLIIERLAKKEEGIFYQSLHKLISSMT